MLEKWDNLGLPFLWKIKSINLSKRLSICYANIYCISRSNMWILSVIKTWCLYCSNDACTVWSTWVMPLCVYSSFTILMIYFILTIKYLLHFLCVFFVHYLYEWAVCFYTKSKILIVYNLYMQAEIIFLCDCFKLLYGESWFLWQYLNTTYWWLHD